MWSQLGFYRQRLRSCHARALAQLPPQRWGHASLAIVSMHHLGLHTAVAQARWNGRHRDAGVAVAVSRAMLGQVDGAREVVDRLRQRHARGRFVVDLARGLSPYMPELALALAEDAPATASLRAALLLTLGERQRALRLLATAPDGARDVAQRQLLLSNAVDGTPAERLVRLNAFFAAAGMAPLALRRETTPPGPLNLLPAQSLPHEDGPCVSVLMTAHNTAGRIGAALDGLRGQTWRNLQIIVVDDASTDHTADVVAGVAEQDARVSLIRLNVNLGTYVAKTIGLHSARGAFVTCHDSDDWSHPQRIAMQMHPLLADRNLVATTSRWVRMTDDGVFHARAVDPLVRLNPASPMFRRDRVRQAAGLWDAVRTGADSEFLARLRLVFGDAAVMRLALPLTLGSHRADSLMTGSATGHRANGLSPHRQAYWEAWTLWHIEQLRLKRLPVMPDILDWFAAGAGRPFAALPALCVDDAALRTARSFVETADAVPDTGAVNHGKPSRRGDGERPRSVHNAIA